MTNELITRRRYRIIKILEAGAGAVVAVEAVTSMELALPEINWDEKRTYQEWEDDS